MKSTRFLLHNFGKNSASVKEYIVKAWDLHLFKKNIIETAPHHKIPTLKHNLDRITLSNHYKPLIDETNYLTSIVQPDNFNYNSLPPHKTASQDPKLLDLTAKHNLQFYSSTSSLTDLLSAFYLAVVENHPIPFTENVSDALKDEPRRYTKTNRRPVSNILTPSLSPSGTPIYAVDIEHPQCDNDSESMILMRLGHTMEKMLTTTPTEFEKHLKTYTKPVEIIQDLFNYTQFQNFLVRSQIDCRSESLLGEDGKGVIFDLKTRATFPIRMMPNDYFKYLNYKFYLDQGRYFSQEREYYDCVRSAFLKWGFQARLGNMHGIFVTHHTTQEILGSQYIPLTQINENLAGSTEIMDQLFKYCVMGMEFLFEELMKKFSGDRIRITVDPTSRGNLMIFVESIPVTTTFTSELYKPDTPMQTEHPDRMQNHIHKYTLTSHIVFNDPSIPNIKAYMNGSCTSGFTIHSRLGKHEDEKDGYYNEWCKTRMRCKHLQDGYSMKENKGVGRLLGNLRKRGDEFNEGKMAVKPLEIRLDKLIKGKFYEGKKAAIKVGGVEDKLMEGEIVEEERNSTDDTKKQ